MNRNESGRFGALKSDSTHHFFRNACTKSGSLRFSQFSGCWLILSVYIIMSFDFPFVRFRNFVITLIGRYSCQQYINLITMCVPRHNTDHWADDIIPLTIVFFWILYCTSFLDLRLLIAPLVFSIISLTFTSLYLMTYYWLCIPLLNWGSNVFVECSIVQIALLFVMPPVCWAAKHTNEVWNILL